MARVRFVLLALALGLSPANFALAQDDALEATRLRRQVAAQKLEQDLLETRKAVALLKAKPAEAAALLERAVQQLKADDLLTPERRKKLLGELESALNDVAKAKPTNAAPLPAERVKPAGSLSELSIVKDFARLRELRRAGKEDEAEQLSARMAKTYAERPALNLNAAVATNDRALATSKDLVREKAAGERAALNDVMRSATPIAGDIQYPDKAKWAEINKRKDKATSRLVPLSDREKQILRTLNESIRTTINFKDTSLDQVIKQLEQEIGLPLLLSKATLEEMRLGYDTTVSLTLPQGLSKRTALRMLLGELGMSFVVKNENVQILSLIRAQQELDTRIFYLRDLAFLGQNPQAIIDFIQDQVDPASWQKHNGPGSITYNAGMGVLIIRNSAEVINQLGGGSR